MKYLAYALAAALTTTALAAPAFAAIDCGSELKAVKVDLDLMGNKPGHAEASEHYKQAKAAHKAGNNPECMAQLAQAEQQIKMALGSGNDGDASD